MSVDFPGVYAIIHIESKRCYIGSSKTVVFRLKTHRSDLGKDKHFNRRLQYLWNKYGEEAFDFVVLVKCTEGVAPFIEQMVIDITDNSLLLNGSKTVLRPCLGQKRSEETRRRMSISASGKTISSNELKRLTALGKDEANVERLRDLNKSRRGQRLSEQHVECVRKSLKQIWSDPQKRKRLSEKLKGRKKSEETKQRMRDAWRRRKKVKNVVFS